VSASLPESELDLPKNAMGAGWVLGLKRVWFEQGRLILGERRERARRLFLGRERAMRERDMS